ESGTITVGDEPDDDDPDGEFNLIPSLSVDTINPDGTADVEVTLDEVPEAGLAGYELDLSIDDTDVAAFETGRSASAEFPSEFSDVSESSLSEDSATIKASDTDENYEGGETDVLLATLPIEAVGEGTTEISISIETLQTDGEGESIDAVTKVTKLTVEVPPGGDPDPVEDGLPAPEESDDGFFGDINGNGRLEYMDVILFFDHVDDEVIQGHVDAFDANDDGEVNLQDVVALFDMI
ncbi:MAG: hypothetical protein ACOCYZ_01515, partial [Halococcoides sp.]